MFPTPKDRRSLRTDPRKRRLRRGYRAGSVPQFAVQLASSKQRTLPKQTPPPVVRLLGRVLLRSHSIPLEGWGRLPARAFAVPMRVRALPKFQNSKCLCPQAILRIETALLPRDIPRSCLLLSSLFELVLPWNSKSSSAAHSLRATAFLVAACRNFVCFRKSDTGIEPTALATRLERPVLAPPAARGHPQRLHRLLQSAAGHRR
jgi:hypothetical protein